MRDSNYSSTSTASPVQTGARSAPLSPSLSSVATSASEVSFSINRLLRRLLFYYSAFVSEHFWYFTGILTIVAYWYLLA